MSPPFARYKKLDSLLLMLHSLEVMRPRTGWSSLKMSGLSWRRWQQPEVRNWKSLLSIKDFWPRLKRKKLGFLRNRDCWLFQTSEKTWQQSRACLRSMMHSTLTCLFTMSTVLRFVLLVKAWLRKRITMLTVLPRGVTNSVTRCTTWVNWLISGSRIS